MKLTKAQKNKLLEWVAEGLGTAEINRRAAEYDQPFSVSRQVVDYYRRTTRVDLRKIAEDDQHDALRTGLAKKSERIRVLQELAEKIIADVLGGRLWIENRGGAKFNDAEVAQLRGILDDIAREVGDRKPSSVNVLDADTVIVYVPDNGRRESS